MQESILHMRSQLEDLRDTLGSGAEFREFRHKEKPEDIAEVAQLAAEVAGTLALRVANFLNDWDFAKEDWYEEEKEAEAAEVKP